MNCYTWMELMKQGLEVLWWKHNMIPTKGSIQQTYPRPATHLWHTRTPYSYLLFTPVWLKPEWTCGAADLLMRHRKPSLKCLQAASLQSSTVSLPGICHRKRNQGDPWSPEECQSPAMHGEYPLLAHTFIQTRVGTPQGPPLPGASSIFISADGAPKC